MQRRKLLYNKRGDLPIIILVIGVFVVCTLTLLNFYFEGFKDNNFFEGPVLIEKVREFSEDLKFYDSNLKEDPLELTRLSKGIDDDNFEFVGSLKNGHYEIEGFLFEDTFLGKGKQLVKVKYNFSKIQK